MKGVGGDPGKASIFCLFRRLQSSDSTLLSYFKTGITGPHGLHGLPGTKGARGAEGDAGQIIDGDPGEYT